MTRLSLNGLRPHLPLSPQSPVYRLSTGPWSLGLPRDGDTVATERIERKTTRVLWLQATESKGGGRREPIGREESRARTGLAEAEGGKAPGMATRPRTLFPLLHGHKGFVQVHPYIKSQVSRRVIVCLRARVL